VHAPCRLWLSFTRSYQIGARSQALARKLEQIKENSTMLLDMRTNAVRVCCARTHGHTLQFCWVLSAPRGWWGGMWDGCGSPHNIQA
jgi:hypothetical protein